MAKLEPKPWETKIWRDGFVDYLKLQKVSDKELERILAAAAKDAEKAFASVKGTSVSATVRRAQYAQALKTLRKQQATLWKKIDTVIQEGMEQASIIAAQTVNKVNATLGKTLKTKGGYTISFVEQFEGAAEKGVELVRARALSKIDLSPLVYKNKALATKKIDRIVNSGLASNKSAKEIAKDVSGYISPNVKGGVDFAAKRLARTEINNAFHAVSVLESQDAPWIEGVKWNLSGSHPKPDRCNDYAEKDGYGMGAGVFPPSKVPGKPHPQCLCYTTAVTTSDDDFIKAFKAGKYDKHLQNRR